MSPWTGGWPTHRAKARGRRARHAAQIRKARAERDQAEAQMTSQQRQREGAAP